MCLKRKSIKTEGFTWKHPMPAPRGWVCPKCGRVNAPFVVCCPCSVNKENTLSDETNKELKNE